MAIEIRDLRVDEYSAFRHAMITVFGGDPGADPLGADRMVALFPPGKAYAAFDGGQIVGTAGTYDFTMGVPGGTIPMAGLTCVTVRPTHRRRGILRGLMEAHFAEARGRGVPVSGLWASEGTIYGRFGYGVAAEGDDLQIQTRGLELHGEGGDELRHLDEAEPAEIVAFYDRVCGERPGMLSRSPPWWKFRRFRDRLDAGRPPPSPRRHVVVRRDGVTTGYVTYRHRAVLEHGVAAGTVEVEELLAVDRRAELSLWRYVVSMDLYPKASWWNAPTDLALPWLSSDMRRFQRHRADTLWLRVEDVAAALAARRYSDDGRLRLSVGGQRVDLVVDGGRGTAVAGEGPADVSMAATELGSIYLGGFRPVTLAAAGLISGSMEAIRRCDRMFASDRAPWCEEIF